MTAVSGSPVLLLTGPRVRESRRSAYESHVIDNGTCDPDETATLVWESVVNGTHRL